MKDAQAISLLFLCGGDAREDDPTRRAAQGRGVMSAPSHKAKLCMSRHAQVETAASWNDEQVVRCARHRQQVRTLAGLGVRCRTIDPAGA